MARAAIIKGDVNHTGPNEKWTGEYHRFPNGAEHKIFVEQIPNYEVGDIIDPSTNGPMYKRGPGGVTLNKKMREVKSVSYTERKYIKIDQLNGIVRKVPLEEVQLDPAEIARNQAKKEREAFEQELYEASKEVGGPRALVEVLKALKNLPEDEEDIADVPAVRRMRRK